MIISAGFFYFFEFYFFGVVIRSKRAKKKWQKILTVTPHISFRQEPYIMWLSFMAHMRIMIIPPGNFFNFSKFWYYKSSRGVARTENGLKMTIKFCLLYLIFQELYIIWSSFIVHMCKRIVSSGISFFLFLLNIWFSGSYGGKRKKNYLCLTPYLRNRLSYDCDFWYTCAKGWYLQQ